MGDFRPLDSRRDLHLDLRKLVPIDDASVQYDADGESVVLSSDSQRLELSARSLDRTLIRNALLCFHFLNTTDSDYIHSAEAKDMIATIQEENPELYEILQQVILVTFEYTGEDSDVWKDDFLIRLRNYIKTLDTSEASPLASLQLGENALVQYFKDLAQNQPKDSHSNDANDVYIDDSDDEECTFTPKINKFPLHGKRRQQLDAEVENEHKFASLLNKSRPKNTFNEFIIFRFNQVPQWDATLRELQVTE